MSPRVVWWFLLPLQEAALGRTTFALWRHLEANPYPDPQSLAQAQTEGLRRLLDHATSQIPYWQNRLPGRLALPAGADPAAVLSSVPVLTRSEIQRNREDMRWASAPGKVLLHSSSGTTDDNLTFYWGRSRQSWDRAMRLRALARHGIFPGDRAVHLWPRYAQNTTRGQLLTSLRALRDWLTNDVVVDLRPLSAERLDAVLTYCRSYRPALLIAYPSWLVRLAERIRAAHPRYRLPSLRLVLCTGEVLFDFQRRFLRDTFAAPVVQEYGSQDAGIIAQEDAAGVLRLNAEQMVVELLRDGNPARPGELGEVVVTHFYTEVMPFIRYATGDVARQPHRSSLPAGEAGLPVFPQPEGRTSDLLATVDARLCPMRPVVEALVEQAGLWQFHLHQPTVGSVIAMQVEGGEQGRGSAPRGGERGDAEEILRSFLGKPLHVEWRSGSGFEPLLSGKWRFVSSPVAMRLLAHDREAGMNEGRAWPHRLMEV